MLASAPTITATAYFSDVGNLSPGAPVQLAGVTVGSVRSITLVGDRAKVVISLDQSARVPAGVRAEAQQSTVLGEEVISLVEPPNASTRPLANGSVISRTALVPGIQQFVGGGTAVLGAIGTSQLASLVDAGGEGLGGQARELRQLISSLDTVTAGYSSRDGEIRSLVSSMNELNGSLAPHASADAEALSNLARTVHVLRVQSQRLVYLLRGLDRLSVEGHSLLTEQLGEIDLQLTALAGVTTTLDSNQRAIAELLQQLPGHDMTLRDTTVNNFSQVIDSIVVCGLPDGGSSEQAASSCHGAGGSQARGTATGSPGGGS
ncbi:MAG TPA: MCE family protein [Acidimicrobiales bacterium]|nr:MCE family protein [Acidimicrobiales bacterium]